MDDTLEYRSSTDFQKIRTMSLEERMNYYKSVYGDKTAPKNGGKKDYSGNGKKQSKGGERKDGGKERKRQSVPSSPSRPQVVKEKPQRVPEPAIKTVTNAKVEVKEPQKKGFWQKLKEKIFG